MVKCVEEDGDALSVEPCEPLGLSRQTVVTCQEDGVSRCVVLDLAGLRALAAEIEARIAEVVALGGEQ